VVGLPDRMPPAMRMRPLSTNAEASDSARGRWPTTRTAPVARSIRWIASVSPADVAPPKT